MLLRIGVEDLAEEVRKLAAAEDAVRVAPAEIRTEHALRVVGGRVEAA